MGEEEMINKDEETQWHAHRQHFPVRVNMSTLSVSLKSFIKSQTRGPHNIQLNPEEQAFIQKKMFQHSMIFQADQRKKRAIRILLRSYKRRIIAAVKHKSKKLHLVLRYNGHLKSRMTVFNVNYHTHLYFLKRTFAEIHRLDMHEIRFLHEGQRVLDEDTAAAEEFENFDIIDVYDSQYGGNDF